MGKGQEIRVLSRGRNERWAEQRRNTIINPHPRDPVWPHSNKEYEHPQFCHLSHIPFNATMHKPRSQGRILVFLSQSGLFKSCKCSLWARDFGILFFRAFVPLGQDEANEEVGKNLLKGHLEMKRLRVRSRQKRVQWSCL
jgi:hypothetical protein